MHTPAIALFAMSTALSLGAVQLWLWARNRDQRWLADWGIAHVIGAVAMLLLGARGAIPDLVSISIANAMLQFAASLLYVGARRFEDRSAGLAVAAIGPAVWLAACSSDTFMASLEARAFLASAIGAIYTGLAAWEFLRPRAGAVLPSRGAVGLVLAAAAAVLAGRGLASIAIPLQQLENGLPGADWFTIATAAQLMMRTAASLLLVSLAAELAEARASASLAANTARAEEANAQKTLFLTHMSHELRSPLNTVLGLAQVLARDAALGDAQRAQARVIEQAGRHVLAITNDLLDLARVEAGRMELAPTAVDTRVFLADTVALIAPQATAKALTLSVDLADGLSPMVRADPVRLRQMLLNLLGNAVKFTPTGGRIALAATSCAGRIRIDVIDTGPGVAAELQARLFQDFARGRGTAGIEGSGLGLAITAGLASAMGGDVTHGPGPGGQGSVFTLSLPLPAVPLPPVPLPPAAPAPVPVAEAAPAGPLHILIVDDLASNRQVLEALLMLAGHRISLAASGEAALAMLAGGNRPDVVLMDVNMPGLGGCATAARIRAMQGPIGQVPIIAVTGHTDAAEIAACRAAGMDGHVGKPVDLALLRAEIEAAMTRPPAPPMALAG
ncbi:hybrid sensor histidine kinase/response regulator [Humitalea sp. 24SJ18S-53]|uniref:hybrid sensor histidine kinase/response regulator n=1 Tax=Humitalea sp. 24SJ18S-53 TaxID=3422307 RepID=UPI003D66C045